MKKDEFLLRLYNTTQLKTLYVKGCFGAPMTPENKVRYTNNNEYNKGRADMINKASVDTFGFDCVCLIKGILWGFDGDVKKQYGGAIYKSNGVPDFGTEQIKDNCTTFSYDFNTVLEEGEVLWMPGHCGVYYGLGLVIECTPIWKNGVQITKLKDRNWHAHGRLKYIDYKEEPVEPVITIYNKLEDCPDWSQEAIKWYLDNGYLSGTGNGNLSLTYNMIRLLVIEYRAIKGEQEKCK